MKILVMTPGAPDLDYTILVGSIAEAAAFYRGHGDLVPVAERQPDGTYHVWPRDLGERQRRAEFHGSPIGVFRVLPEGA